MPYRCAAYGLLGLIKFSVFRRPRLTIRNTSIDLDGQGRVDCRNLIQRRVRYVKRLKRRPTRASKYPNLLEGSRLVNRNDREERGQTMFSKGLTEGMTRSKAAVNAEVDRFLEDELSLRLKIKLRRKAELARASLTCLEVPRPFRDYPPPDIIYYGALRKANAVGS